MPAPKAPKTPQPAVAVKATGITIDSVISLIQAGLSEDVIIVRLRKQDGSFVLSPADMIKLKRAGASDGVLTVMMDPKAEIKVVAPPPTDAARATPAPPEKAIPMPVAAESLPSSLVATAPNITTNTTTTQQAEPADEKSKSRSHRLPNLPRLRHSGGSSTSNWKDQLKEQIEATWSFSKIGFDRIRVTEPGIVLVIKKDGIIGDLSTDSTFSKTTVEDGKATPPKGAVAFLQNKETSHVFKAGERVYLWKVAIDDNNLALFLISCETFAVNAKGTTKQLRYKALLDFKFSTEYLPTAEFASVKASINGVLATEQEYQGATTKSVSLGQTPQEVEGVLGKPEKIVNLGAKVIYVYKDIKIIFSDGKVTDVQ